MNLMQYFSPFVIPGLVADELSLQRQNVQAAKKRLLSEFELLGNPPTIQLAGWELDRNELLETLEGMNDASTREYHLAIHRDKNLLEFLEQHELSGKSNFSDNPLYSEPGFIAFISPYFSEAYRNAIVEAFRNRDIPLLIALKKLPLFCTHEDQDRCYRSARSEVVMLVASVNEETASTVYNETSVMELTGKPTLEAVAALPEQVGMRENFFEALCELCITLFNKHKKQHKAIDVLYRVKHANVNSAINEQAAGYIRQMERIMSNWREQDGRRQVKGGWLSFGVIIIVIILVLKIALPKHNPKGFDYRLPQGFKSPYAVTMHADTIAQYMHAYYLEHPADDSTAGDVVPPQAGSHPYASALDHLFKLRVLLNELKPDSTPGVYFVNNTREDLALLLRTGDKSFSMSLYIPDGDSCFSSLFDCPDGFVVYVSAGSRWNGSKAITLYSPGQRSSIPSLRGAFSSPDRKNLDLLLEPVEVKSGPAPPGMKHYRLVFSRNKKGKIGTKLFPGDDNVK